MLNQYEQASINITAGHSHIPFITAVDLRSNCENFYNKC